MTDQDKSSWKLDRFGGGAFGMLTKSIYAASFGSTGFVPESHSDTISERRIFWSSVYNFPYTILNRDGSRGSILTALLVKRTGRKMRKQKQKGTEKTIESMKWRAKSKKNKTTNFRTSTT